MKKYLLICVTYHSDKELQAFLESVRCATERVKGKLEIDIEIVDNGAENLGYLGGALPIYNAKAKEYDYISISNVDMELAPDFFEQLLHINSDGIGWIAPDIYTPKIDRHENPYMLSRPTRHNFTIWNIIYSNTLIYHLYYKLYLLKSKRSNVHPDGEIYAGHGSFMLFTKAFVEKNTELHFPGFMYGEEIYMAELVRKAQLKVAYCSTLRIANIGNINTGSIEQKLKSQWSKESLRAIKHMFFD